VSVDRWVVVGCVLVMASLNKEQQPSKLPPLPFFFNFNSPVWSGLNDGHERHRRGTGQGERRRRGAVVSPLTAAQSFLTILTWLSSSSNIEETNAVAQKISKAHEELTEQCSEDLADLIQEQVGGLKLIAVSGWYTL
jgi:hypothetical protein